MNYKSFAEMMRDYFNQDIYVTQELYMSRPSHKTNPFSIKDVIFNDPAVIVLWNDGTKTVVKCDENDIFDPEKGLAMAISKKALGNQGNYYNTFKKYLPEEEDIDDFGLHPEASLGYSWIDMVGEKLDGLIKNLKKDKKR